MRALPFLASLLLGIVLLLTACTSNDTSTTALAKGAILPPFSDLAPSYQEFTITTTKENKLTLPSGTTITIPAGALVDVEGKEITGEATILYREYHDAAGVILSGIPMDYTSNGKKRHFQTAGMFDIAGKQGQQELSIKEGSGIQVDLASFEEGTDYNLFSLDEQKGWEFVDYVAPVANPARAGLDEKMKTLRKKMGKRTSPYFVFSYEGVLDVQFNNSVITKEDRANSKVRRKFKAYDIELLNSTVYRFIKYENTNYPIDMLVWQNLGKRFPAWVRQQQCKIELSPIQGKTFQLTASKEGKVYKGKIRGIMPLKYLFDYSPERWRNNIATVLKDVATKEEKYRQELEALRLRQEQQAAAIRSFEIAGFGVYNYDRLLKEEEGIDILADFQLQEVEDLDWVICLPEDGKTVIKYPKRDWDKVVLLANNKARFVTILPDQRVAVYSAQAYQALDFEGLAQRSQRPQVDFKLEMLQKIDSEESLRKLLTM